MRLLDWAVIVFYLVWIVWDGLRRTKASNEVEGYFLANRSLPWWAAGLSVMATQMSAITLVGTTGQAYADGMRFVQFYFGLPIAMVILSVTLVPFFYRAHVYTAYEYLERRFDAKTRMLASLLFLASRSMSCGVIIAAPALILSIILGWNLQLTVLAIGIPTALYTMFGGVQAVAWTDVKQMGVVVSGVLATVVALIIGLPHDLSLGEMMHVAGAVGRLRTIDFSFDLTQQYTFWSGTIAGLFLMLSYFGCDQSQVQRYLTAKSVDESRSSLMVSAYVKIPLQALILMMGVLVFVFYLFTAPPMLFRPDYNARVAASTRAGEFKALEQQFQGQFESRRAAAHRLAEVRRGNDAGQVETAQKAFVDAEAAVKATRTQASAIVKDVTGDSKFNDVNYVFPTFVTTRLPMGLVGLMIAAIFAAAMSASAGEMNALATATVIDVYRRHLKPVASDAHYLMVSKLATGFWGLVACVVAIYATSLGSLIEVVNRFGSFFYGSLLGVFVLALGVKRATSRGAFVGLIAGMSVVAWFAFNTSVAFLWHNVIGVVVVVVVGMLVSLTERPGQSPAEAGSHE